MSKVYILIFLLFSLFSYAQIEGDSFGAEYKFNPDNIPCITPKAKAQIKIELQHSIANLMQQGKLTTQKSPQAIPNFIWPVKAKDNSGFTDVWAISNYVDHDKNFPNKTQDYNCGTRTYDTTSGYNHQGTDMYTWPFTWYQFQHNIGEVIAAAPGTIIYKHDGEPDMSCSFNNNKWNAIYIRHSDQSIAWYGHLKKGSLTSKNVGQTVSEGEFLGIVGSSGNSTGPHLHFEVYDKDEQLIDPYSGNCSSATSWWKTQPDYYEPAINAIFLHNAPPDFKNCPIPDIPNIAEKFKPNTTVLTATYYKDQISGTTANYRLLKPNGTVYSTWSKQFSDTWSSSYWYWTWDNLSEIGIWTFESSYQGQTETKTFELTNSLAVNDYRLSKISSVPNPFEDQLKLVGFHLNPNDYKISIYNQLGQKVFVRNTFSEDLNLGFLTKGMYFLKITNKADQGFKTFTLLKK